MPTTDKPLLPPTFHSLTTSMHELAIELAALRQEVRGFRESVAELRAQVGALHDQTTSRHGELIELRTQHRVLWAVSSVAGATSLTSVVLGLVQILRHMAPGLLLLVGCALLMGCGDGRLQPKQAQDVADGLAGITAAQSVITDPATGTMLAGAVEHIEAAAAGTELPPPVIAPAAIVANPVTYQAAAQAAAQAAHHQADMTAASWTVPWWGWLAGAASTALAAARMLPGPGGALADLAWTLLAPDAHRQRDRRQQADADAYQQMTEMLASLAPHQTVGDLRNLLTIQSPPVPASTTQLRSRIAA